ncbi:MAG: TolC family protein [Pirellulaceae bacterium]
MNINRKGIAFTLLLVSGMVGCRSADKAKIADVDREPRIAANGPSRVNVSPEIDNEERPVTIHTVAYQDSQDAGTEPKPARTLEETLEAAEAAIHPNVKRPAPDASGAPNVGPLPKPDSARSDNDQSDDKKDDKQTEDDRQENKKEKASSSEILNPLLEVLRPGRAEHTKDPLLVDEVIASVRDYFPLLELAYLERDRTLGNQIAAWGSFDTKAKANSENEPLGFYENYRHEAGVVKPLYRGGEVFGGYRIGRGSFEPWYLERETNKGGEFKAGFMVPLVRNREIDQRRAELWRATYDRQLAEPMIRAEVIMFIQDASFAYWEWVAAGRQLEVGEAALKLAMQRNEGLEKSVDRGAVDPPVLQDNLRAIAERQAKLTQRRQKLEQAAYKLSLYLRDANTMPIVPQPSRVPDFPKIEEIDRNTLNEAVQAALLRRPELQTINTERRRVQVDLAEAANDLRPNLDAALAGSQDVGEPTSDKRDKSEFELEVGLYFEMPIQRRKGIGKVRAARAKLAQLDAKQEFTVNKITVEVQNAFAALDAAYDRVESVREAVRLSAELARIERRKFDVGQSDLLAVFQREQFAIEAADAVIEATQDYFLARTAFLAALAYDFNDLPMPSSL